MQERALEQLGGYNIVFGRQAAQLVAAHEREREFTESASKPPSRRARNARGDAGAGNGSGSGSLEKGTTGASGQSSKYKLPAGQGMPLSPHAEEHEGALEAGPFATGIFSSHVINSTRK